MRQYHFWIVILCAALKKIFSFSGCSCKIKTNIPFFAGFTYFKYLGGGWLSVGNVSGAKGCLLFMQRYFMKYRVLRMYGVILLEKAAVADESFCSVAYAHSVI